MIFTVSCVNIIAAEFTTINGIWINLQLQLLILSTVAIDIAAVAWVQMVFMSLGFNCSWLLKAQNAVLP